MSPNGFFLGLAVIGGLVISAGDVYAQRGISGRGSSRSSYAQRDLQAQKELAQRMQKAQEELAKEQQVVASAMQELLAAKHTHREAGKALALAEDQAEAKLEESLGIKKALAEQQAAQEAVKRISAPVLSDLHSTPAYTEAQAKATAAKAALDKLKSDETLSDADRKSQSAPFIADSLAVSNLEKSTLAKNSDVVAAKQSLEAIQKRIVELRKKAKTMLETDAAVKGAKTDVSKAHDEVKAAEARVAQKQSQLAMAERLVQAGVLPPAGNGNGNGQGNKTPDKTKKN
jgi:chromosome segregation ATPase